MCNDKLDMTAKLRDGKHMKHSNQLGLIAAASMMLIAGCGESDISMGSGPQQLIDISNPQDYVDRVVDSLETAGDLNAAARLEQLFATPGIDSACKVKVSRLSYVTEGGAGEAATSSGVLMAPYGDSSKCGGDRPTVLYAHGTTDNIDYDLSAAFASKPNAAANEAYLLLNTLAMQGFNVIAPNYAGYADSDLGYHPYVDTYQQSREMVDAYEHVEDYADALGLKMSDKLFVTGYSQGGIVAMATHKYMQSLDMPVTASAPMSGPYAMVQFIDTILGGRENGGATLFAPMYVTALQNRDSLYSAPTEVYAEEYADTAEGRFPGKSVEIESVQYSAYAAAIASGKWPSNALTTELLSADFVSGYVADSVANPDTGSSDISGLGAENKFRAAVAKDDMRSWTPKSPVMMCGHSSDPVVFFKNTGTMKSYWEQLGPLVSVANFAEAPYSSMLPAGFADDLAGIHSNLAPYCLGAAVQFFGQVLAQ